MLLLPALPIATTQMNAPTPTEMPRIVRTLLTQLRFSATVASRTMFVNFIASCSHWIEEDRGSVISVQGQCIDSLRNFSYGNHNDFLQSICVNGRYRSRSRVRNIDNLTVWCKRDPLRHGAGWWPSQRMNFRESCISQQLEFRKRVLEDRIGDRAIDPQRFPIRRHPDAVRGSAGPALDFSESAGLIGQFDSGHLQPLCEIHDRKSVEPG